MRPVDRGPDPETAFPDYAAAREPLAARLGYYCSYCGISLHTGAEVEHVKPKIVYPEHRVRWTNLLLACKPCNTVKSDQDPIESEVFWPDRDNTQRAFIYGPQALVDVNPDLSDELSAKARRTLVLTGLNRTPADAPNLNKDRWRRREIVWQHAVDALSDFVAGGADAESILANNIIRLAVEAGIWPIWVTVFRDYPVMLRRLNQAFPGTAADCFDEHFQLIPRPGGLI